jgi:hypothetical protein
VSFDEVHPGSSLGLGVAPPRPRTSVAERVAIGVLVIAVIAVGSSWAYDNSNLNNRVNDLSTRLTAANATIGEVNVQLDTARQTAAHPTLGINNTPQTISANTGWLAGGLPDTFTYHFAYTSDVLVEYAFMTYSDYVKFATCNTNLFTMNDRSVSKLAGCLYDLGGPYAGNSSGADGSFWGSGTHVSINFYEAEGCAGWVEIMFPEKAGQVAHVTPNTSVTYNPSRAATGGC